MTYDVEIRFNSVKAGGGLEWSGRVEAECVHEALDIAIARVVRLPHGQAIFVTGCSINQRKKS